MARCFLRSTLPVEPAAGFSAKPWSRRFARATMRVCCGSSKALRIFDRIARARIFLDTFRSSPFRPEVLDHAHAAEDIAADFRVRLRDDSMRRKDGWRRTALHLFSTTMASIVITGKASLSLSTRSGFATMAKLGRSWCIVTRAARKLPRRARNSSYYWDRGALARRRAEKTR